MRGDYAIGSRATARTRGVHVTSANRLLG